MVALDEHIRTWADIATGNTEESITRTFAAPNDQCAVHLGAENHLQVP